MKRKDQTFTRDNFQNKVYKLAKHTHTHIHIHIYVYIIKVALHKL